MCAQKIVAQLRSGPRVRQRIEKREWFYAKQLRATNDGRNMVRPERFELPTCCSGGNRSIQLSYGRNAMTTVYTRGRDASKQAGRQRRSAARQPMAAVATRIF